MLAESEASGNPHGASREELALSRRRQLCQHPCALPEAGCCPGLSGRILLEVTSLTNTVEFSPFGKLTRALPLNIHPTLPKRSPFRAEGERGIKGMERGRQRTASLITLVTAAWQPPAPVWQQATAPPSPLRSPCPRVLLSPSPTQAKG